MENKGMDIKDYNLTTSEEELIKACQGVKTSGDTPEGKNYFLNYFLGLLSAKEQSKANKRLVKATWVLAGATILLTIVAAIINICN